MKRLMTSKKTGTWPAVDILTTCCASLKRMAKRPTYITLFEVSIDSLRNIKKCLKFRYPNMEEAGRCNDPNAIHQWSIFKGELIEKPNYYKNYFSLTEEKQELLETILDVTI